MNFFSLTALFLAAVGCAHAATIPTTGRLSDVEAADLKRRVEAAGGCNVNVCFAIDGGELLSKAEIVAQKNLIIDLMAVIGVDEPIEVAAIEYGAANGLIQPLTGDIAFFVHQLRMGNFSDGPDTFGVSAFRYCVAQLVGRLGEANKIVFFADGTPNIGSSAIRLADLFRVLGGEVCAVGAGFDNQAELLRIVGGDPSKVFRVGSFLDALALMKLVEDLAAEICQIKLP